MKTLCALLLFLPFLTLTNAEDEVRNAQNELKEQGFFFAEPNGVLNNDTTAAIRRYQIRYGLPITAKLDNETLVSLGLKKAPSSQASPAAQAKPQPESLTENVLPQTTPRTAPPAAAAVVPAQPIRTAPPTDLRVATTTSVPRMEHVPNTTGADLSPAEMQTFFHGTPYASAPTAVQTEVISRAQELFARAGLLTTYKKGIPDGSTADAIFQYQGQIGVTRTGRLDQHTLGVLKLLPQAQPRRTTTKLRPFRETFRQ